jgi:ribonuclease HI
MWSSEEALKSSTYRELKAVFITLFSLQEVFQNRLVKIYTDNQNVVTNTGSRNYSHWLLKSLILKSKYNTKILNDNLSAAKILCLSEPA